jgi:hypothetical protein
MDATMTSKIENLIFAIMWLLGFYHTAMEGTPQHLESCDNRHVGDMFTEKPSPPCTVKSKLKNFSPLWRKPDSQRKTDWLKAIFAIMAETQNGNYCRNGDQHLMPLINSSAACS